MKDRNNLETLKGRIENGAKKTGITGLSGSAQSYFFSQFLSDLKKPCLLVLPDKKLRKKSIKNCVFLCRSRMFGCSPKL